MQFYQVNYRILLVFYTLTISQFVMAEIDYKSWDDYYGKIDSLRMRDPQEAVDISNKFLNAHPASTVTTEQKGYVHATKGHAYSEMGNHHESSLSFETASYYAKDPATRVHYMHWEVAEINLAVANDERHMPTGTRDAIKRATEGLELRKKHNLNPGQDYPFHKELAYSHHKRGNYQQAVFAIEAAIRKAPPGISAAESQKIREVAKRFRSKLNQNSVVRSNRAAAGSSRPVVKPSSSVRGTSWSFEGGRLAFNNDGTYSYYKRGKYHSRLKSTVGGGRGSGRWKQVGNNIEITSSSGDGIDKDMQFYLEGKNLQYRYSAKSKWYKMSSLR